MAEKSELAWANRFAAFSFFAALVCLMTMFAVVLKPMPKGCECAEPRPCKCNQEVRGPIVVNGPKLECGCAAGRCPCKEAK